MPFNTDKNRVPSSSKAKVASSDVLGVISSSQLNAQSNSIDKDGVLVAPKKPKRNVPKTSKQKASYIKSDIDFYKLWLKENNKQLNSQGLRLSEDLIIDLLESSVEQNNLVYMYMFYLLDKQVSEYTTSFNMARAESLLNCHRLNLCCRILSEYLEPLKNPVHNAFLLKLEQLHKAVNKKLALDKQHTHSVKQVKESIHDYLFTRNEMFESTKAGEMAETQVTDALTKFSVFAATVVLSQSSKSDKKVDWLQSPHPISETCYEESINWSALPQAVSELNQLKAIANNSLTGLATLQTLVDDLLKLSLTALKESSDIRVQQSLGKLTAG